jgi:hypothetical protein
LTLLLVGFHVYELAGIFPQLLELFGLRFLRLLIKLLGHLTPRLVLFEGFLAALDLRFTTGRGRPLLHFRHSKLLEGRVSTRLIPV